MSWDKTRAEYARKARSMPTGQTHVSVLAKDLEYLCEQAENGEIASSLLRPATAQLEQANAHKLRLISAIAKLASDYQRFEVPPGADPRTILDEVVRDLNRVLLVQAKGLAP